MKGKQRKKKSQQNKTPPEQPWKVKGNILNYHVTMWISDIFCPLALYTAKLLLCVNIS